MKANKTVEREKRHGCLTALMAFIFIGSLIAAPIQLLMFLGNPETTPGPRWLHFSLASINIIKLVSAYAILSWKKWGFWLFTLICFFNLGICLISGFKIGNGIFGVILAAMLFGVLQIGGDKKAWNQLE